MTIDTEPDDRIQGSAGRPATSIQEAIEDVGFGKGQILAAIAACGLFFAEGLELLLMSLLADSIVVDLIEKTGIDQDSEGTEGIIVATIFGGSLLGNMLSGPLADRVGRQWPIILAYFITVFCSVWATFQNTFLAISGFHFMVGLGFGLGQPAAVALLNEITPQRYQLATTAFSSIAFGLGALLAVLMVMGESAALERMTSLEWRLAGRCGSAAVALMGMLATFFLPESPAFLAESGDYATALDTIRNLHQKNGKPAKTLNAGNIQPVGKAEPFVGYLEQANCMPTVVVCATSLVVNFALYGAGFAVPQVLEGLHETKGVHSLAPATVLLLALVLAGVTTAVCTYYGTLVSRKTSIIACLGVGILGSILFTTKFGPEPEIGVRLMLLLACFGMITGPAFCYLCLVQVSAVMYPTARTATDISACMVVGRIGTILAPIVYDIIIVTTGKWYAFFNAMAIFQLICLLLMLPMDFGLTCPHAAFLDSPKGVA